MSREFAKRLADKYIMPDGSPVPEKGQTIEFEPTLSILPADQFVTIPLADYKRLVDASELDDCLVRCDQCDAWLDTQVDLYVSDDFTCCLAYATGRKKDSHTCKSYRSLKAHS